MITSLRKLGLSFSVLFLTNCSRAPPLTFWFLLSGMAPMPCGVLAAHGCGPLAAPAPWCCTRASNTDLSEPDCAFHVRALAHSFSLTRKIDGTHQL